MIKIISNILLYLFINSILIAQPITPSRSGGSSSSGKGLTNITSSAGFTITLSGSGGNTNADIGLTTDTPQFSRLGLGNAADANNTLTISNSTIAGSPLVVNAFSGTTNDLLKVNNGGTNVLKVDKTGAIKYMGATVNDFLIFGGTANHLIQSGANALGASYTLFGDVSGAGGPAEYRQGSGGTITWQSTTRADAGTTDLIVGRDSAATLQLGADAASVVTPQSIKAADGSGTDKAGADFQLEGGQSTGTGRAGAVILRTGETLTTGSSANAYITRFYLSAKSVDLTNATAVLVFNVSLASGKTCGLHVFATTRVDDGTDFQGATDDFTCVAVNKAGTVSIGSISTSLGSTVATSGTISTVWTAVANGNGVDVKCNQTTTVITPTTRRVRWRVETDSNDTALAITPQ